MNHPLTSAVIAIFILAGARVSDSFPSCSQEHLIQCASSIHYLSDNKELSFAANKEDLDRICPDLNSGLRCIDEYTRRCMEPHQRSHFNKLYAGSSMTIQEICQEGPYQDEFLKHATCMWEVKDEYEECAKDYQKKTHDLSGWSNESSDGDHEHHVRRLCCSFQDYLHCAHTSVKDACGVGTADFTKSFLDRMASSLIQVHCEKYPPGSQICEEDYSGASLSSTVSISLLLSTGALVLLSLT